MLGPLAAFAAPLVPALPLLAELLLLIIALGILYSLKYVVRAFFGLAGGALGKLPVVGGWLNTGVHTIENKVSGIMGEAVSAVEGAVGASWHQLARLVDWIGHEIRSHGNLLWMLATVMLGQEWAGVIRHAIADFQKHAGGITKAVQTQTVRIIHAEERLRHGIGDDVLPRLRSLDRALDRVRGTDLPRIRARERALERGVGNLWKWARSHPQTIATGAFAGAVAWALGRVGASWVRCNNWNRVGKQVCGMDASVLDALLADALLIAGTLSLVTFAEEMQDVVETAIEPIARFWQAT